VTGIVGTANSAMSNRENGNKNEVLSWKREGMQMEMISWEWKGMDHSRTWAEHNWVELPLCRR